MSSSNHASMQQFKDAREQLGTILTKLANIAEERGDEIIDNLSATAKIANRGEDFRRPLADALNERAKNVFSKEAFRLAVIGEFNAGKSTLINALLGRDVLSTSPTPKTAAKTILRHGEQDAYRVIYNKNDAQGDTGDTGMINTTNLAKKIEGVTSDDAITWIKRNTESVATQIKQVEIWCKSDFLNRDETEIVDTPGLGSIIEEHKVVTYSLIPEMDATLVLFPSQPGFGEKEIDLLDFIRQHINQLLFVMTKADYLSSKDQEKMLDLSKEIIENIVKIPVERVYAVSALKQIEGKKNESGFNTFLKGLESFLVSSSGVARLQMPFAIAQTHCKNLIKNTQHDIQNIDKDVESLQNELKQLEDAQSEIEKAREKLLITVEQRMKEIVDNALDGIEELPFRVERAVNKALDEFKKESLKKVDIKIQPIINEVVEDWVKTKDKSFMTQVQLLQDIVESELNRFVQIIDDITFPQLSSTTTYITSNPDISIPAGGHTGRLVLNTTAKAGGALVAGAGTTLIGYFAGTTVLPALLPVVIPILTSFPFLLVIPGLLPVISDVFLGEQRIRNDIKKQLTKPIPGNKVTIFQAIVEGYVDKDRKNHPGLRESLQTHFDESSNNLKSNITNFVANLVGAQLIKIKKQIDDKKSNRFDREQRSKVHATHEKKLEEIAKKLAELKATIQEMSSASTEESTPIS
ncbi:MAG: dynamin family protein [Pleurocapsa sp. MO_226.B13]|nr:dynamin family protein [Pleurocapsa sp. MO_226.B13]